MRRYLLALAFALSAGAASAADLPVKAPVQRVTQAFTPWTGVYVGANVGWGWAHASATVLGVTGSEHLDGVIGGGQIGYNWQTGPLVLGIEADIQGSDQHRTTTIGGATVTDRIPWFGTVRGRLGYAQSAWMLYATGGWAYGEFRSDVTALGTTAGFSDRRSGWTAGAGLEWMFAPKWSAKIEYLYIDTGHFNSALFGLPFTGRVTDNIARVGVNYHF